MKKHAKAFFNCIIQILIIASLSFLMDYLVVVLTNDDSIWIGEAIWAVGSIICGPVVGGLSSLFSCVLIDYITYNSLEYSFVSIFEAMSMALIGMIYRSLVKDEDKFGVREIAIFNFVQILVNVSVLYLSTPPAAVLFFSAIIGDWSKQDMLAQMSALRNNAFSACISLALIGTVLLAACIAVRKKWKETGSFFSSIRSILKLSYIKREYRSRALEYSVGIFFAIALSMIDGVVSGHVLGMDALAATSIMFPLVSFSTFFSNIMTSGCSNLCAIAKGDGDYERARKLFSLGLFITIILGLLQTLLFYLTEDLYFQFYTTTDVIAAYARDYYKYYIFVPPFMALAIFFDEIAASEGDDMLSYIGYLISFGVNVGASIMLSNIMGMAGLSLGTLLSYVFYVIVVSTHFLKKSNTYRLRLWFSFRDLFAFAKLSLKTNTVGLCMSIVSAAFTKAIIMFWGNDYLIANTVLCAMLEIYEIINGPSEAAEYLFATYAGEKNREGIKILFKEVLMVSLVGSLALALLLLLLPGLVLIIYGIESTSMKAELIKCIRYCAVGVIAAAVGGFLSDYYGDTEKPLWSCMMDIFRVALFPILFCVTFSLEGGIVAMGVGMLLSQIFAVCIFFGFVIIIKGADSVPYMLSDPDYEKVHMNSFEFSDGEYERINEWIKATLKEQGIEEKEIKKVNELFLTLCKKTEKINGKNKVLGECVIRFIGKPEIIIKDNGKLWKPDIEDACLSYNVLLSCNSNTMRLA